MKSVTEQKQEREKEMKVRAKLIRRAREGDEEAQRILSEPPYKIRVYTDKEIDAVEHRKEAVVTRPSKSRARAKKKR